MLVCHQAFFPRHTLVEPYNLKYRFSADFDWCIRIMKKARTLHNTHLTIIDYLDEGMTTRNQKASLKERFRIMAKHLRADRHRSTSYMVCDPCGDSPVKLVLFKMLQAAQATGTSAYVPYVSAPLY